MRILTQGVRALLACALLTGVAAAQQMVDGRVSEARFDKVAAAFEAGAARDIELAGCQTCDQGAGYDGGYYEEGACCGTDDCCGTYCDAGGCDLGLGACRYCRPRIVFGAEYLNVRAEFSEATAYREYNTLTAQETFHQFDMDYGDSYRTYVGFRLDDCGSELRFTYTNFDTGGSFDTGPIPDTGGDVIIQSPFEVVPSDDGDSLFGRASVSIDNYDLGFSKTIPLGCRNVCCDTCCDECCDPCCEDACGSCCDPCGCCVCPAWDIEWSGGIRVSNVDSSLAYGNVVATPSAERSAVSRVQFDGVGLRSGLLGRRYIGQRGYASLYLRGDLSLLLGDVDYSVDVAGGGGGTFLPTRLTSTEVIPVTEIEAGGTVYLSRCLSVSGGYLLSAWHDLGHRAEYDFSASGTQLQLMDDANMLTIDGWFLRAEATY